MLTNEKTNDKLVLFRKSDNDNTNRNMNNAYPCPSNEFNNNLGSSINIKHPNRAILSDTNLLKIKNAGIIIIVEKIILTRRWIFIICNGSVVPESVNTNDNTYAHPVLVLVYPIGKLPSKMVFAEYTNEKKPSVAMGTSNGA